MIDDYLEFCRKRNEDRYHGLPRFKGEILPFIHFNCRKDMTSGDIDGYLFDYKRKYLYFIESKRLNEKIKKSQLTLMNFISEILQRACYSDMRYLEWTFDVFYVIGDPPFNTCILERLRTGEKAYLTRFELKDFFELKKDFNELQLIQNKTA